MGAHARRVLREVRGEGTWGMLRGAGVVLTSRVSERASSIRSAVAPGTVSPSGAAPADQTILLLVLGQGEGLLLLIVQVLVVRLAGASLLRSLRAVQARPRGGRAVRAWFAPVWHC